MTGFQEHKRQRTGSAVSLTGALTGADGAAWAECTVQASPCAFSLDVVAGDTHVQASIRVQKVDYGVSLPEGAGDIRLNGAVIANYVSCGCFKPVGGRAVRVVRDDGKRRFLWARAHGCTYREAAQYAGRRDSLLVCGQAVAASFAGYHRKGSPFFTPGDGKVLETLPPQEHWCVLALCLMQNLYGADRELHTDPAGKDGGHVQKSDLGKPIPDIPSFVPAPEGGVISIDPADVRGGIRWRDKLLLFPSSKYQYTIGIPFYIMTIPMVRQSASPTAWGSPEWIVAVLWSALLFLFAKFLVFPGYKLAETDLLS